MSSNNKVIAIWGKPKLAITSYSWKIGGWELDNFVTRGNGRVNGRAENTKETNTGCSMDTQNIIQFEDLKDKSPIISAMRKRRRSGENQKYNPFIRLKDCCLESHWQTPYLSASYSERIDLFVWGFCNVNIHSNKQTNKQPGIFLGKNARKQMRISPETVAIKVPIRQHLSFRYTTDLMVEKCQIFNICEYYAQYTSHIQLFFGCTVTKYYNLNGNQFNCKKWVEKKGE